MRDQSAAIFDLFLEWEAEFGVRASVTIDQTDLADASESGFLADAATYAARRAASEAEGVAAVKIVVLTTMAT